MNDPLANLTDALAAVADSWRVAPAGTRPAVDQLTHAELVKLNRSLGALRRHVEAVHTRVASEIARQSSPDLGADGLAKKNGYRSPAILIAATTGTTVSEANRLLAVGEATAPRRTFDGTDAPPRHPHVAAGIASGGVSVAAASTIVAMLDRVGGRGERSQVDEVERLLVEQSRGLTPEQVAKIVARAEAHLDPEGLEEKEHERHRERSLVMFERAGMLHLNAKLDAVRGAPVKAAIEAIVTAEFRNEQDRSPVGAGSGGEVDAAPAADGSDSAATGAGFEGDSGAPRRTVAQRQADALIALAEHMLGCESGGPIDGVTVVVRMTLEDLQKGTGHATIDGIDQPVSIGAARRMASSAGVIPCVLSGESEILDWGRRRRLFSGAQKLALGERDGGCAMCGLPPGMTKVHHIRWWARDAGPTDLSNGILLCETCHHRIHDNGWDIRIDGPGVDARVWFIPPSHVDPRRTPRLGGARRYAFAAAR